MLKQSDMNDAYAAYLKHYNKEDSLLTAYKYAFFVGITMRECVGSCLWADNKTEFEFNKKAETRIIALGGPNSFVVLKAIEAKQSRFRIAKVYATMWVIKVLGLTALTIAVAILLKRKAFTW